jgi:hypothetical protein
MKQLKSLIENMIQEYRENGKFSTINLEKILFEADFVNDEIGKLINKFHFIATEIADNGGMPVLKQIYNIVTVEAEKVEQINSKLSIVKLGTQKFKAIGGYYLPKGFALKHPELGYLSFVEDGGEVPYNPIGGRKALKSILEAGGLLNFDNAKWLHEMA